MAQVPRSAYACAACWGAVPKAARVRLFEAIAGLRAQGRGDTKALRALRAAVAAVRTAIRAKRLASGHDAGYK